MKEIILLFVFTLLFSLSSCDNKKEVSGENNDPSAQESSKEGNEKISELKDTDPEKKEESNPQSEQTEDDANKTNELGMTPGMPPNFPEDIPQPLNSKVIGSLTSTEGTMVTFESTDKVQDIINYYKDGMKDNGYTISEDGELITPDKGGLINWNKQDKEVQLVLGYDKDNNKSSLVITYK
jgi:hypothetical protein